MSNTNRHTSLFLAVILMLTSCTSFQTREGLYYDADLASEGWQEKATTNGEADIVDEEIALAAQDPFAESFDLSKFTSLGEAYTNLLRSHVATYLVDKKEARQYKVMALVPKDDMMSVVNVEVEYLLQKTPGNWTDKKTVAADGQAYQISSFREEDGIYSFNLLYMESDGSYRRIVTRYDDVLDRFDYKSESYDRDDALNYSVRQQFCSDHAGGYYYQALRQGLVDGFERVSFSHFSPSDYQTYIRPSGSREPMVDFALDLFEEVPTDIKLMTVGYEGLGYFENIKGVFDYEVSE